MSEIKQADPASILLPLSKYATPTEEKKLCQWMNEKGVREGELCELNCGLGSDKYCSAHILTAKRRGIPEDFVQSEVKYHSGAPKVKWSDSASQAPSHEESVQNRYELAQDLGVDESEVLSPQEIQQNVERLKKLDLLDSMMKLLQVAFSD